MNDSIQNKAVGSLVGLAAGDALGTTIEFKPRGTFEPLTDIVGGGPFRLPAGAWTDDTSMALCLAESLVECRGIDPRDQIERYVRWWRDGHWSSTGRCFDIGNATSTALRKFERHGEPYSGSTDRNTAGNGSIMRLAPVPMFFADDPARASEASGESSRTTHGARTCVDACRLLGPLLVVLMNGRDLGGAVIESRDIAIETGGPLHHRIEAIASGSFASKSRDEIRGTGYVVESLEAALWAVHSTGSFRDAVLAAANLGDDADTTGAIAGQIAGALYGLEGIPREWREILTRGEEIEDLGRSVVVAGRNSGQRQ